MTRVAALFLLVVSAGCGGANGNGWDSKYTPEPPTDSDIQELRGRVQAARDALRHVPAERRPKLEAAVAQAEASLGRFESLSRKGARRKKATGFLYMAGAATIANDPSGVGLADNVLVPFIILGIIATHLATDAPAPPRELAQAWDDVIRSLEAVGAAAAATSAIHVDRSDCIENYVQCQESELARVKSGGRSQCQACLDIRKQDGWWPDSVSGDSMECRWWIYR